MNLFHILNYVLARRLHEDLSKEISSRITEQFVNNLNDHFNQI